MQKLAVIMPAAGRSTRFGGGRSKLLEPLDGMPVIARSVQVFLERSDVVQLIVATAADQRQLVSEAIGPQASDPRVRLCEGGDCRAASVRNALAQVHPDVSCVAVHDAARPLVSRDLIDRTLAAAHKYGAAAPALPINLTIKQAQGPLPAPVKQTIPRDALWGMQTPQIMRRADLAAAYQSCPIPLDQVTDDIQLLELRGQDVWLVAGEEANLKITTLLDLRLAEFFLTLGLRV